MTWSSEDDVHVVWTFCVFFTEILWCSALVSAKLDRLSSQGTENGRSLTDDWTWAGLSAGCCFSPERLHFSRDSCQRETCCRRPQSIRKMIVVLWTDVKAQPKAANISQELMEEELWCAAD